MMRWRSAREEGQRPIRQRRTHRFDGDGCTCSHEDWQHSAFGGCAGGRTASSCPCVARWHEDGWEDVPDA